MAQLADEFDALRRERDAALARSSELTRDHDRLAALPAELSRLSEEREQTSRQVETYRIELDEVRSQRDADRQAYEQALSALRDELAAARHQAESAPALAPNEPVPGGKGAEERLAEVQSQLELVEASRSVVIDALKVAQKQVQDLTLDLNESLAEQKRVRAMLNNMGIHLL